MLLIFSVNVNANDEKPVDPQKDTEDYERCIRQYPCNLEGKSLHHLSKKERNKILSCRLARHMKCVVPEDTIVLDPVYEYYKIYGEYLYE